MRLASWFTRPRRRLAITAFRCAQEALTNVVKYAQASQAEIRLREEDGAVVVEVLDDGVGFDPADRSSDSFGLLGMRERATALDGDLSLQSAPQRGTTVRVRIPYTLAETP